jgi:hypothetical protein
VPEELDRILKKRCTAWTSDQRDAIGRWVSANSQALEQLETGACKPYYCPDYQIDTRSPTSRQTKAIRNLTLALHARIGLLAWDGEEEEMVRDIVTLYRFGDHFGGRKSVIHQLTGAAIRERTIVTARDVLASCSSSVSTLDALYETFRTFSNAGDHALDFSLERLIALNNIQKIFTDNGHGHGHVAKAALKAWPTTMTPQQEEAFLRLERDETTQQVEGFFKCIQRAAQESPWERHDEPDDVAVLRDLIERNAFLEVIGPAYVRLIHIPWRAKTELDALVTILAALRYEADRGEFADSLDELVKTGYLKRVPHDNYSSGPLVYRRTEDNFLLYSCGLDFDDDAGTPSKWGQGEQGGDQVFWPVLDQR